MSIECVIAEASELISGKVLLSDCQGITSWWISVVVLTLHTFPEHMSGSGTAVTLKYPKWYELGNSEWKAD